MSSQFNFILMLPQSESERLLTEQLARQGVKVERGVEVTAVTHSRDGVEVTLRNEGGVEEIVPASYVIAADGPHSVIRKSVGLPFPGRVLPRRYVLADLHADGDLAEDQVSIFLARGGFVAVFPMAGGRYRLMTTDPSGIFDGAGDPTVDEIQQIFDRTVHIPVRLHTMNWSSQFRINSRHMRTLRSGRVFFGGDAAHVHSPAGGQGMNVGIQDMVNLSWKLAMVLDGRAKPELLDTYSSERLPVIRTVVRFTEIGTRIFNSTNPIVHAVRIWIAPRMLARDRVQNAVAAMFGQLSAGYRDGVLTEGVRGLGALRPGDRVPDVDGRYDALDLDGLTLFAGTGADSVVEVARRWSGVVSVRTSASLEFGRWMLVRPDGYLAAAGEAADVSAMQQWLNRWFVRR